MENNKILIIDLGSERNTEIARFIRSKGVYSEIKAYDSTKDELGENIDGIIINTGKNREIDGKLIDVNDDIKNLEVNFLNLDDNEDFEEKVENFVFNVCGSKKTWTIKSFVENKVSEIRKEIGDKKVLLALSGGVDSSVVAALLIKAIGNQLTCVHVNHGLLRKNESENVIKVFQEEFKMGDNLIYVDAVDEYLDALKGVADPEKKRKIIGGLFIEIFERESNKLEGIEYLAQGTIYPDILESGTKTQKTIKSHHNVGGLPENLDFKLIEPLSELFKDEVRKVGIELGLPEEMVYRQPFPGPGLGVRCIGAITKDRLEAVRESDAILREEFKMAGLDKKVWQYFTVIPDVKSVGIIDGNRSYDWPVVIRAVNTIDALTAEIEEIPYDILSKITYRITHEVRGVNRVLYDITPKPTGSIEWE